MPGFLRLSGSGHGARAVFLESGWIEFRPVIRLCWCAGVRWCALLSGRCIGLRINEPGDAQKEIFQNCRQIRHVAANAVIARHRA